MADSTELEHLQDGIASEFWRQFSDHVTKEWGPAGLRYQQAVRDAAKSHEAVVELQKVIATQEAIIQLMEWPHGRIAQLKARTPQMAHVASRRGPGL